MLRIVLIVFGVLLLTPIVLSVALPGIALSAMNVDTTGWRNAQRHLDARLEDVQECQALLARSSSSASLPYRGHDAACGMCATLLAAVPDPQVTNEMPAATRVAAARAARDRAALRAELSEGSETLRRTFLRRQRAVARFERGRLNPVQTTIDLQASFQCDAPA